MTAPVYRLFYSAGACSLAPHIVLEDLGVAWEPVAVTIAEGANRKPEYLAINPRGRVPALEYASADGSRRILTESTAILMLLGERHPDSGWLPADAEGRIRVLEFLCWLATTMHQTGVRTVFRPERFTTATDPAHHEAIKAAGRATIAPGYAEIEARLAGGGHAVGNQLTVADAMLVVHFRWGGRCGYAMRRDYPHYAAHVDRLMQRPAFARAVAREGIRLED